MLGPAVRLRPPGGRRQPAPVRLRPHDEEFPLAWPRASQTRQFDSAGEADAGRVDRSVGTHADHCLQTC
jgi:hypothetical protein